MLKKIYIFTLAVFITATSLSCLYAEEKKPQGMPPAVVVVSDISTGMITPESVFVGTVYYQEVSDVASEVTGKVEEVLFDEGDRVKKGAPLVRLSSDLLLKTLEAGRASHEQALAELEKAHTDFRRAEKLYAEQLISEESYDDPRFRIKELEKKSASLMADVERLETELHKKEIVSPYDGVIIKKHVDRGEWLSQGGSVATIARDDEVDIVAEVPEDIIRHARPGMRAAVTAGNQQLSGKIIAIIPRGDISTRTFPVKVRVKNSSALIEGMEARLTLPSGEKEKTLTVSRDAVVTVYGNTVVYTITDSKAMMVPVRVIGYEGMTAGIAGEGLQEGMKVAIKGNERLRPGQTVVIKE